MTNATIKGILERVIDPSWWRCRHFSKMVTNHHIRHDHDHDHDHHYHHHHEATTLSWHWLSQVFRF